MKRQSRQLASLLAAASTLPFVAQAQMFTQEYSANSSISGAVWGSGSTGPFTSAYSGSSAIVRANSTGAVTVNLTDPAALGTVEFRQSNTGQLVVGTGFDGAGNTAITIGQGVIRQTGSNRFNSGATLTVNSGATFDFRGSITQTFSGLSGSGIIQNQSTTAGANATLTVSGATDSTFGGTIRASTTAGLGDIALVKSGAGTLTLTNSGSTYTRGTTINGGAISIAAGGALGSAPALKADYLTLNGGTLVTTANGNFSANRGVTLGASGGTVQAASGTTWTFSSVITGNGGLTVSGLGNVVLAAANNYSGPTVISSGTLSLGANNVIADGSALQLGAATLAAQTFTDTLGALSLSGNGTISLGVGGALAFADSSALSWGSNTLSISGTFIDGASIRFGTTASGLSSGQLANITVNNVTGWTLNDGGYLTAIPEPSSFAALAGLGMLGFAAARRRRA